MFPRKIDDLPEHLKKIVGKKFNENGTIVTWTKLDKAKWKQLKDYSKI